MFIAATAGTVFAAEFASNSIHTMRGITLNQNKNLVSSILDAIGTGLGFITIGLVLMHPTVWTIGAAIAATFCGSYIPAMMFNRPQAQPQYNYNYGYGYGY
jgi:hypothetical protein